MDKIKKIFYVILIIIGIYFFAGQILIDENPELDSECQILVSGWNRILKDGTRVPIALPSNCKAERNEEVIIEIRLPEKIGHNICVCQRSSQQNMGIYIDGELRHRYTTEGRRLFGKNSMSTFVFADLNPDDAGKMLQIRTVSDSRFTGRLNTVYYGEKVIIWKYLFQIYGSGAVIALCTVFLSIVAIIGSSIIQMMYRQKIALKYLAWGIFLVSFWMLTESRLRQIMVPNNTIMGTMAYAMVTLIPIPFLFYMDDIQRERYHKVYSSVALVSIVIFSVNVFLQLTNSADFLDTLWIANVQMVLGITIVVICVVIDYVNKRSQEYEIILSAFIILFIAGISENILTYVQAYQSHGTVIGFGLIIALIMGSISTGNEIRKMEEERRMALATNQLKSEFLIDISKKIRMPINTMMGMNEKIIREEKDKSIREYAVGVRRIGNTIQSMIDELFDYSLVDSGKLNMVEANYNTMVLVNDIAEEAKTKCEKKNLQFKIEISNELPATLFGDEIRIHQIVTNLINTAVKYTDEGNVDLRVTGNYMGKDPLGDDKFRLVLIMNDSGMGLKDSDVAKLYKSFANYKNRADTADGLELGLSISKKLVERMNGEFHIQSIYGNGTKFVVRIPQLIKVTEQNFELKEHINPNKAVEKMNVQLINEEKAMTYCVDEETCIRVLKMYCRKGKELQKQLEEAVQKNDLKQYQLVLHSMKSSALTIAADGLCDLIVRQENLARNKDLEKLKSNHIIFMQYYISVLEEAANILERRQEKQTQEKQTQEQQT